MSNDQDKRMTALIQAAGDYYIDGDVESTEIDTAMFLDPNFDEEGVIDKLAEIPRFLAVTVRGGDDCGMTYGTLHDDFDAAKTRMVEHVETGIADEFPRAIVDLERDLTMRPDWGALTYKLEN